MASVTAVQNFRDAGEFRDFDLDSQLFGDLAPGRFARRFTEVYLAAGQTPCTGFRFGEALDE